MLFPLKPRLAIFFTSLLILLTELSLIRFLPAQIRLTGYFTNLILLATFLGMGVGLLVTRSRRQLPTLFPPALAVLLMLSWLVKIEVNVLTPDIIFFNTIAPPDRPILEPTIVLPLIFLLTALVFIPLSQFLGQQFRKLPPLTAYTADILGAVLGIIIFSLSSALSAPPFWWFLLIALGFLLLRLRRWKFSLIQAVSLFAIVILPLTTNGKSVWSPYYKITVTSNPAMSIVDVNGTSHQYVNHYQNREDFYFAPYRRIRNPDFRRILVIGAGTGADTAVALHEAPNLERLDAVEIDPWLLKLGNSLNPDQPYRDSRVVVHVADGRNFLERSKETYDLIIFALPDSLILNRGTGNIRLESFLFTAEAFKLAKEHLSPDGLFVLYNFYRQQWLIERLSSTLSLVFGSSPLVETNPTKYLGAVLLAGPKIADAVSSPLSTTLPSSPFPLPTDDWPFLYLKNASIPFFYLKTLAILGIISVGLVFAVYRKRQSGVFSGSFFFLGAGFMLLETKSLVTFSLLFGTTWLVNSLVFSAILVSVLLANLLSTKIRIRLPWLYAGLFLTLLANYFIPQTWFFSLPLIPRYLVASVFYFLPILWANLIFSQRFRSVAAADAAFAANLLGCLAGGFLEYAALVSGYRALYLVVLILYGCSLGPSTKHLRAIRNR